MHRLPFKLSAIATSFMAFLTTIFSKSVFADDNNCVQTTFFGEQCGKDGIFHVLDVVVNVMTAGIGILAVIGIVISGVQYLTAGGNEEQTKKAKRRILEIVIGLAAYVLVWALLKWLLPGFNGTNISNGS